jgi:hypothetical protein
MNKWKSAALGVALRVGIAGALYAFVHSLLRGIK